jgi:hypothetical protein
VGVMHEAIEDGVGNGGVADNLMPLTHSEWLS